MKNRCSHDAAICAIKEGDLDKLKDVASAIPNEEISDLLSRWNEKGEYPLYIAIYRHDAPIVKFLLEECHVDPKAPEGSMDSLYLAVSHGELEIVELLIEFGAKRNSAVANGSLLYAACIYNHLEIARLLIEKGEDIDTSNCITLVLKNEKFVEYLLQCGVDVNQDRYGETILITCCQNGYLETVKILLQKGADKSRIYEGLTALQWAALNLHEDIVIYYSENNLCTRDEELDCFELMGLTSVKEDLPSTIRYWNKVLRERAQSEQIAFESEIFGYFQRKFSHIKNYDHLIDDQENAVIHSMIMLERMIGIKNLLLNNSYGKLFQLMSMNIEFWRAILRWTSEQHISCMFYQAYLYFTLLFARYAKDRKFKNINSSILKLFYDFFNASSDLFSFKVDPVPGDFGLMYRPIFIIGIMTLYSIKDNVEDFDFKLFYAYIKSFRNSVFHFREPRFHFLIEDPRLLSLKFPDEIRNEAFALCCKLCEPMNYLDWRNESLLFKALENDENKQIIDILLEYGANTCIKNKDGVSIRDRAILIGRQDLCVGSPSLQILINPQLHPAGFSRRDHQDHDRLKLPKNLPAILKNLIKFY